MVQIQLEPLYKSDQHYPCKYIRVYATHIIYVVYTLRMVYLNTAHSTRRLSMPQQIFNNTDRLTLKLFVQPSTARVGTTEKPCIFRAVYVA